MKTINLEQYKNSTSNTYTGRPQGEACRKEIRLDEIDNNDEEIEFQFPRTTESINPSFYLGLLFTSIKKLGGEEFQKKYKFKFLSDDLEQVKFLTLDIEDAYRNAINSINNNTGLKYF